MLPALSPPPSPFVSFRENLFSVDKVSVNGKDPALCVVRLTSTATCKSKNGALCIASSFSNSRVIRTMNFAYDERDRAKMDFLNHARRPEKASAHPSSRPHIEAVMAACSPRPPWLAPLMDTQLCIEEVRAAMLEGEELDTVALVLRSSEPEVNKDATVVAMLCLVWSGCLTGMLFIVGHPNYSIWQQMHCIPGITPFDSLKWISLLELVLG
jgi:hypothetical protein